MTKQQFKDRWESGEDGGGITWNDVATVAKEWKIFTTPYTKPMSVVLSAVLRAAGVEE